MIWTEQRRQAAREACQLWKDTPHKNRISRLGVGIDCIRFVCEILKAVEVFQEIEFPYYSPGHGLFRERNFLEDVFLKSLRAERIEAPEFGALIVCKVGMNSNHCGIVIDGKAWHVARESTVKPDNINSLKIQSFIRINRIGLQVNPSTLDIKELSNG